MADGAPPPVPPERGRRDDTSGETTPTAGTPLALNDPHASQVSKELQNTIGRDLEDFLKSTDLRTFLQQDAANNVFAIAADSTRCGARSRAGKLTGKKRMERQNEQREGQTASAADADKQTKQPEVGESSTTQSNASPNAANSQPSEQAELADDASPSAQEKPKRRNRGSKRKPLAAASRPAANANSATDETSAKGANVWTKAREVLLRQQVEHTVNDTEYTDRVQYRKYYEIAEKADYRVIPDGRPRRPMTDDELRTLYLWRTKGIHLVEPPKFVEETHTLKERLMFDQIQRDLLTYSLHVDLPGRVRMPVETVKFHFYSRLLAKNQGSSGPNDRVISLMADVLSISVSASSRRAILNFDRPEKRDKWEGEVLAFPFGAVTLRAASYFEQEDKKHGIDQDTVKLLYTYFLIGRPDLALTAVHAIALQLSGGFPILKIEPVEPTGEKTLDPHMWKITLNSVDAPPDLEKTRELTVQYGEQQFNIGVHQPRLATRPPCSICLDTTHFRNKCPNKATAHERRLPYMRTVSIPASKPIDYEPVADDLAGFRRQLGQLRAELEPDLEPAAPNGAGNPEPPSAPGGTGAPPKAPRTGTRKSSVNTAQLDIIIKAKKTSDSATKAAKPNPKKKKTKQQPAKKADGQQAESTTAALPTSKPAQFGRTRFKMPAIGSKRDITEAEAPTHPSNGRPAPKDSTQKTKSGTDVHLPPTRQQRTDTTVCVSSTKQDTPRTRTTLVFEHARPPAAKARTEQLTMTPFLPKLEEATNGSTGPEVEIVGRKAAIAPPIKLPKLLAAIEMTEVRTPQNGSCWKYALVIVQAYECGEEVNIHMKEDVVEAAKLGRTINMRLRKNITGMIADGSVDRVSLCSTVLGKVVQHDYVKQLQAHFAEAARQPADVGIARKFWGGEPEFKVFVEWVKEPLYVVDVLPGGECFPQWYHLADVRSADGSVVQRAVVTTVSEAAFRAHMAIYKRNHVVPLVLLLHHSTSGHQAVGHVTAARVSNATYKHWAGSKRKQQDMKTRLLKVVREMQGVDHELEQFAFPTPSPPATPGSGSVSMEEATASANTQAAAESTATASGPVPSSMPNFQLLTPHDDGSARLPISVLSALSLDSQPNFSSATLDKMLPVSLASPADMPIGDREDDLIRRMSARPPYDSSTTRQIKRVYKSNNTAYENWKARQKKTHPSLYAMVHDVTGPIQACTLLQDNIGALVQLVHSLPYPEVHMATVPDATLIRAGQAASCLGQAQMIHRVQAHLAASSQAFCTTWVDALVADDTPPDTRWHLSQASEQWKRLEQAVGPTAVALPERSHHGVPDPAWYKMLAYLLMVPGNLPWAFAEGPLPQRCDALATWLAMVEQTDIAQGTAEAIDQRRWLSAREVFPTLDYGPDGNTSQISSPRAQLDAMEIARN